MFGIPTPQTLAAKALCALVGALALLSAGAYAGYRWEHSAYLKLQLADAQAMTKAVELARSNQMAVDAIRQRDAVAEARFQGSMDQVKVTITGGVPNYVTAKQDLLAANSDSAGCVTYGFYRVLAAGQRGVTPENLPLPSGQSNDACTGEPPSAVAASIAASLVTGVQNAEQLNALEGDIADVLKKAGQGGNNAAPALPVKGDVPQPHSIDASDAQPSPPGQREANNTVEPQIIEAPRAKERGWEPVDAVQRLVPADGPDVEDLKYGAASFKGSLGQVRVNVHFMYPDW